MVSRGATEPRRALGPLRGSILEYRHKMVGPASVVSLTGMARMKKLKLSLDDLHVSSFRTMADEGARGTVQANSACAHSDIDCTAFYSTCDPSNGASCDGCPSANTDCGGMVL